MNQATIRHFLGEQPLLSIQDLLDEQYLLRVELHESSLVIVDPILGRCISPYFDDIQYPNLILELLC